MYEPHVWHILVELQCGTLVKILLSDHFFLKIAGVLEYNPKLSKKLDFRGALQNGMHHHEVTKTTTYSINLTIVFTKQD